MNTRDHTVSISDRFLTDCIASHKCLLSWNWALIICPFFQQKYQHEHMATICRVCNDQRYFPQWSRHVCRGLVVCESAILITFEIHSLDYVYPAPSPVLSRCLLEAYFRCFREMYFRCLLEEYSRVLPIYYRLLQAYFAEISCFSFGVSWDMGYAISPMSMAGLYGLY